MMMMIIITLTISSQDESYFEEYGQDITVHFLMLQDKVWMYDA